jgi:hypothetical protein
MRQGRLQKGSRSADVFSDKSAYVNRIKSERTPAGYSHQRSDQARRSSNRCQQG